MLFLGATSLLESFVAQKNKVETKKAFILDMSVFTSSATHIFIPLDYERVL